jgi:hypothetical protein
MGRELKLKARKQKKVQLKFETNYQASTHIKLRIEKNEHAKD